MTLSEAVDGFRSEGWVLSKSLDKTDYKGFLDKISSLSDEEFLVDIHIPDLLIFPPKTQFYNHPAYKNGSIILQDKVREIWQRFLLFISSALICMGF